MNNIDDNICFENFKNFELFKFDKCFVKFDNFHQLKIQIFNQNIHQNYFISKFKEFFFKKFKICLFIYVMILISNFCSIRIEQICELSKRLIE